MESTILNLLNALELGEAQTHKNMTVFPLFAPGNGTPEYLTLKEALQRGVLTISEISHGGSVPELMAINKADIPVLLLDGEELSGAKQNRVLNTTILIKEHSETVIPVSCTEHGRWSYSSPDFDDSGIIMAQRIRRDKSRTVHENLRNSQEYVADQGQVWADIADMSVKAKVHSATGAMKDVYESTEKTLDEYLSAFPFVANQKGLLVFLNNTIAGFDMVSLATAYSILHQKLVKSYAMEAHLDAKKNPHTNEVSPDTVKPFFDLIKTCKEETYPSTGHGMDHRFEGDKVVGSALVYLNAVIHMAFFTTTEAEKTGRMSGLRTRRGYRVQ